MTDLNATLRDVLESRKHRLKERGIVNPIWTCMAAKKAGLRLYLACALLEIESGGGRNVFGHDDVPTGGAYIKGGKVTKASYRAYRAKREILGAQGVGPTQLTWPGFQDRADSLGGCWVPRVNLYVGFGIFADHLRAGSSVWAAAHAYNGSTIYADHFLTISSKWQARFVADKAGK